jgi:RNA polymerase sigma factor (sigma-70 family)
MEAKPTQTSRQIAEAVLLDAGARRRLFAYARSQFGIAASDTEDLLQETAFELLRQQSYVRQPEDFVFVVFRARCARFAAARRASRGIFTEAGGSLETLSAPSGDVDRQIALREALGDLSPSCRRLLAAHYIEGKSLREAARLISLKYSGVGKTISRCLRKLRRLLA